MMVKRMVQKSAQTANGVICAETKDKRHAAFAKQDKKINKKRMNEIRKYLKKIKR